MQGQGVLCMLKRLRQGREQLEPGGEVADGFQIGRALAGALPRPLPVGDGLRTQACLSVVLRQQLGLRLGRLWKLLNQHLCNALVILLTGAPQQGLIRSVLDERMLERVGDLRRHAPLIHQLRVH